MRYVKYGEYRYFIHLKSLSPGHCLATPPILDFLTLQNLFHYKISKCPFSQNLNAGSMAIENARGRYTRRGLYALNT